MSRVTLPQAINHSRKCELGGKMSPAGTW